MAIRDQDALEYHREGRPGKTEVVPTKPCLTARDLSLAYSPGVAVPCEAIAENPDDAYLYTNKGNLVAVVSNGTAVLGLGNIGALAGKPVMEGKGVLFKRFADVDVFDIELDDRGPRGDHQGLPAAGAHLRRHQPRGHQGSRVLPHRGSAEEDHEHPGLPRRPARHGHHLRRRADQRRRAAGQGDRGPEGRGLRRRRRGHRLRQVRRGPGRAPGQHHARRQQGRLLQGPHRRHEQVQGVLRRRDQGAAPWPTP